MLSALRRAATSVLTVRFGAGALTPSPIIAGSRNTASAIFMNTRFPSQNWSGLSDQRTGIRNRELGPPQKTPRKRPPVKSHPRTTAIPSFRRIVLAQESNHRLQHLQSGLA